MKSHHMVRVKKTEETCMTRFGFISVVLTYNKHTISPEGKGTTWSQVLASRTRKTPPPICPRDVKFAPKLLITAEPLS